MRPVVKDKVYYMSESLGVSKSWVCGFLDVSDTTLTKWSYNPANVSAEMSERIFTRIAILDALGVRFKKCRLGKEIPERESIAVGDWWAVSVGEDTYYLPDIRKFRGLPSYPPKALVALVRNAVVREENQHPLYVLHKYKKRRDGPLSKIAANSSLEMPLGVIRWEKDI